ncbi:hypothetical protein ACH5RR_018895 [Cinchona calisaya]|uniref:Serpin domain-containing protein n=1 Tax=Cinchona calisaya TaxID=153742 RepID=A0ABD2ZMS8_9GENT
MEDEMFEILEIVDNKDGDPLVITDIIQKAFTKLDEEGTEAAVVTFSPTRRACARFREQEIKMADHPFLFIIKEKNSESVLFTGATKSHSSMINSTYNWKLKFYVVEGSC